MSGHSTPNLRLEINLNYIEIEIQKSKKRKPRTKKQQLEKLTHKKSSSFDS